MSYKLGDNYYKQFTTVNPSGVCTNLDSLPTGVLVRNGLEDFSNQVYFKNNEVGLYTISGTILNTYNIGDVVNIKMSGYMSTNLVKAVFDLGVIDKRVNDLFNPSLTGIYNQGTLFVNNPVSEHSLDSTPILS